LDKLSGLLFSSKPFDALKRAVEGLETDSPLAIEGIAGSLMAQVVVSAYKSAKATVVVVAPDEDAAERLRDDCVLLAGAGGVQFFGARPGHHAQSIDLTSSVTQIETLKALAGGEKAIVIAYAVSIVDRVPLPATFTSSMIEIAEGGEIDFNKLLERLPELGFERKEFVESFGDFAVRGGIVDVFPYIGENPLRIEFWGNAIESIREFDVLSQRSIRTLKKASIVPDTSSQTSVNEKGEVLPKELPSSLFDYLAADAIILLDDPVTIQKEIDELATDGREDIFDRAAIEEKSKAFRQIIHLKIGSAGKHVEMWGGRRLKTTIDFVASIPPAIGGNMAVLLKNIREWNAKKLQVFLTCETTHEAKRLQELIEDAATDPQLATRGEDEREGSALAEVPRVRAHDEDEEVSGEVPSTLAYEILPISIHSGFIFLPGKLVVVPEHEIFGRLKRRGLTKRKRFKGISQKELQQLKPGDFVVHVDHGIGTFEGLTRIKVGNAEQEVIKVLFQDDDVLYVNLNSVTRIQKFSSQEGHAPKLSKLGAPDWEKMKARAKKRIKDIARDLIKLYAMRKSEQGFAFAPDSHWQKELEASFMYEDTPDQAKTMLDVKRDMESESPMDRLVCGDVGFGKTEIAVRAAFKAVNNNKQAAVLVPTTILAMQHFQTFSDRLKRFGVRVELLTRFQSKKTLTETIAKMKEGAVDIAIGTHRLLSKDIGFKDLGLLVIDEEQRFGVASKEKLRTLKASVDTLTLTATPIPRTLHFSLIGARDLSLINTPPRNRLPVTTEIVPAGERAQESQWQVVREAVVNELHRGGQVYFVHDRVQSIDAVADQVRSLVREARVRTAHGQMEGHHLEEVMLDFLEKKFDVLVCTKIIESGLDIPSVNTIVINRADRFGLAELYQLRGRVGRSNAQAFAYLLTPPLQSMPKPTLRRLQAIEEFAELGSGFNLAMRDLEIRGAGNLLGGEQTGFIMEMGFEMYERVVREAVDELKRDEFHEFFAQTPVMKSSKEEAPALPLPEKEDAAAATELEAELETGESIADVRESAATVDAEMEALIPSLYIESDAERLDFYRRLYRASTREQIITLREELRDRFGEYPEEVENLFGLVEIRLLAGKIGFSRAEVGENTLALTLPPETRTSFYGADGEGSSPFQKIMERISKVKDRSFRMVNEGKVVKIVAKLPAYKSEREKLVACVKKLEEIEAWVAVDGK
jgi:transcription-repair coupling factor (superfamily II helicase)